jgi:hypothetical protein
MPCPSPAECRVIELRQYLLRSGRRDELVTLFDREFVETQEEVGMKVLGQFRDLDAPQRFVWLRGFADMRTRLAGLQAFYGGPVWARHGRAANATMMDSDDVLLLRPAWPGSHAQANEPRPPVDAPPAQGEALLWIFHLRQPAGAALLERTREVLVPHLRACGAVWSAWYVTEPAANDFPRLPVREGVQVLAGLSLFADPRHAAAARLGDPGAWMDAFLTGPVEVRRLAPTARSELRA